MYFRFLEIELKKLQHQYPVITLLGPRQSGKTTLVKATFPQKPYVNLEALDVQEMAQQDPRGFLARYPMGAILDEIQKVPSLLSYIQVIVDERDEKGMFILTGSHQLLLHHAISQSLAGRTILLTLFPLSLSELQTANIELSIDETILKGGYPRIYKDHLEPSQAYRSYLQTYVEKDLRDMIHLKNLSQFQKFMRLIAGRIGQLVNFESLSNEVGVSAPTIKEWLSLLEASFILIKLQPYFENFGKRVIKSPKLYFTDVGLACTLLGIETVEQLSRDPLRGNLVENLLVLELIKSRLNQGQEPRIYYFRDTGGHEVDVVFQSGHHLIPIEIKSSMTFSSDFLKNLKFFTELVKPRSSIGFLLYSGEHEQTIDSFEIMNYKKASSIFQKIAEFHSP